MPSCPSVGLLLAFALLALLALLTALAALALLALTLLALALLAALHAPLLALAERLVAQLLLLAGHVVHVLHGAVHLARQRIGHAAVRPRGLQVLEDVAQLVEEALRLGDVAAAHHLLHLVEHAVEVVLA